ncbi:MAG: prenyltransferase/squalene oxidase repeat-containing protein [Gemmataceae bacterium]
MLRLGFSTFVFVLFVNFAPAQTRSKPDELEKRVDKALAFLARVQQSDGSWKLNLPKHPAATSLAVMAFLSAGHVPGEGPYGEVIEKGVRWVLKIQRRDGLLATTGHEMYQHGISTLMLAEVSGMVDKKLQPKVKMALEKAVKLILRAQRKYGEPKGGWRYQITGSDSDMSVTGWQLLALRSAKNLGCDVPAERIKMAIDYILRSKTSSGGFSYRPNDRRHTIPCTGTGILCLELCHKHHAEESLRAGSLLLRNPPNWNQPYAFYNFYYSSQATFQLGGNYWTYFRPRLHKLLFANQNNNGAWLNGRNYYGPVYATSMCVLALTVEYRYLPIYQRGNDSGKQDDSNGERKGR